MNSDTFPTSSPSKFEEAFDNFEVSAFRLEQLPFYSVDEELLEYRNFMSGGDRPSNNFNSEWNDLLTDAKNKDKKFSRVRVIDGPLTPYQEFEILWAYKTSVELGEEIRFLLQPEISYCKMIDSITEDFWIFDDNTCFSMNYDSQGRYIGVKRVPKQRFQDYLDLKRDVLKKSVAFKEGLQRLGLRS